MIRIALKDLRLFFYDKRSFILTFALPMALITLFALAFGGTGSKDDDNKEYVLSVCDLDKTPASRDAFVKLEADEAIHVELVPLTQAQEEIKKGKKDAVLVIHKGYADSLREGNSLPLELQYDEAQAMQIGMLQQSLFRTVMMLPFSSSTSAQLTMGKRFDKMIVGGNDTLKREVHQRFDTLYDLIAQGVDNHEINSDDAGFSMGSEIKMTPLLKEKEDQSLGLIHAVAGTSIMMLLFSVAGMGASLLDEKQEGTLKKLLYSPIRPSHILYGKIISSNILSIMQLTVMFLFAYLVFGLSIQPHLLSLSVMIVVTAYACSSFGVLLASFAKSRQQVQGLSTLIVLVMSCIGGSMIPTPAMPEFMQKISVFSVNYWGIQGFYDIFWRELSFFDTTFLSRIAMLLLIGTVLNVVALQLFKKNILKIA